jgi:hypothetical protein
MQVLPPQFTFTSLNPVGSEQKQMHGKSIKNNEQGQQACCANLVDAFRNEGVVKLKGFGIVRDGIDNLLS